MMLAALREGDRLVTACVGDSALLLLRPISLHPLRLEVVFRTEAGRYDARRPKQVQRLFGVEDSATRSVIRGASVQSLNVQPRDLVIMGSDGLFDNVSDEDIRLAVEWHTSGAANAGNLGMQPLPGTAAAAAAAEPPLKPAWAMRLREAAAALVDLAIARVPAGGNADDTTALVAVVAKEWQLMEESAQPPRRRPAGVAAARGALQQPGSFVAMPPYPPRNFESNVLADRTNAEPLSPERCNKKKQTRARAPPPLASVESSFVAHRSGCVGPNLRTLEMAENMTKDACPIS
jgi:serine/threonine protein phosphatase PrpC